MKTQGEETIECAIRCATAAWGSGRCDDWPDAGDYRMLEAELRRQPDHTDRQAFAAAWYGYMARANGPDDESFEECLEEEEETGAVVLELSTGKEREDD